MIDAYCAQPFLTRVGQVRYDIELFIGANDKQLSAEK